jgi:hypothetical protein
MKRVRMADWGEDHWSLLAYVECTCVDSGTRMGIGKLDPARMHQRSIPGWKGAYGTRLSGYRNSSGSVDPKRQLPNHDDFDCLRDLEAAGLVDIRSWANLFVWITDRGLDIAHAIRRHKARGGCFWNFQKENL